MPQGDGSKEECFRLWKAGKSTREIKRSTTAKYESIKMWVREWERGSHRTWDVDIDVDIKEQASGISLCSFSPPFFY